MRIRAVIPVILPKQVENLIHDLSRNTLLPEKVFIIDNSGCRPLSRLDWYPDWVEVFKGEGNCGVNDAWNYGNLLCRHADAVAILNDDIRVGKFFLEKIAAAFNRQPDAGVICPLTKQGHKSLEIPEGDDLVLMSKREGWAMSFRRSLLDRIPLIPADRIRTFCGDDWYWHWTYRLGMRWYKDLTNIIRHEVGISMGENPRVRETLRAEKAEFGRILQELGT